MTTAFIVTGPESSGTRIVTQCLIACGCRGDSTHQQAFDNHDLIPPASDGVPLVWRRSVPHNFINPDYGEMIRVLTGRGYQTQIVVVFRNWYYNAASQRKRGHATSAVVAYTRIAAAWDHLVSAFAYRYIIFSYDWLCRNPRRALGWLSAMTGMPDPDEVLIASIQDTNSTYE